MKIIEHITFEACYYEIEGLLEEKSVAFIGNCLTPFHLMGLETILLSHPDLELGATGIIFLSDHSITGKTLFESHFQHVSEKFDLYVFSIKTHSQISDSDKIFLKSFAAKEMFFDESSDKQELLIINPMHVYVHALPLFHFNEQINSRYKPAIIVYEDGITADKTPNKLYTIVAKNKVYGQLTRNSSEVVNLTFSDYLFPLYDWLRKAGGKKLPDVIYDALEIVTLGEDGVIKETNLFRTFREVVEETSELRNITSQEITKPVVFFIFFCIDELPEDKRQHMLEAARQVIGILGTENYTFFGKHHPRAEETDSFNQQLPEIKLFDKKLSTEEIFANIKPEFIVDYGSSALTGAKIFSPDSKIVKIELLNDSMPAAWKLAHYVNSIDRCVIGKHPNLISSTLLKSGPDFPELEKISIILSSSGSHEKQTNVLNEIHSTTRYPNYEVLILSSEVGEQTFDTPIKQVITIVVDDPSKPLDNIKDILSSSTGNQLVFLNGTSTPKPFWLYGLVNALNLGGDIQGVGGKIINEQHLVQHIGYSVAEDTDSCESLGFSYPFKWPSMCNYYDIPAHSLNGFLFNREALEALNTTNERVDLADIFNHLSSNGGRIIHSPDAIIVDSDSENLYEVEAPALKDLKIADNSPLPVTGELKTAPEKFILVIGMPGEGLSQLADILIQTGYNANRYSPQETQKNENPAFSTVNDTLMEVYNSTALDPPSLETMKNAHEEAILQEMMQDFVDHKKAVLVGWQFSFTLPAWQKVLFKNTKIVYVETGEAKFINELTKAGIDEDKARKLWVEYKSRCESYQEYHPLLRIDESQISEKATIKKVYDFAGEDLPEFLEVEKSFPDKKSLLDEGYSEKLHQEIAIYEHNDDVHALPKIHDVYADEFIGPNFKELSGCQNWMAWWIHEIDQMVEQSGRNLRLISLACGNGDTEIKLLKRLKHRDKVELLGVDVNPNMIERGREAAASEGLENVHFEVQDLNNPGLKGPFDVVMANHSLHHLVELEKLFNHLNEISSDDMIFLINDMIGRNGHVMWPNARMVINELWRRLDQRFKLNAFSKFYDMTPFNRDCSQDGFEGIRAQDILPALMQTFDVELFFPFATLINRFVDRGYGHNFNADEESDRKLILDILALDVRLLKEQKLSPTQAFIKVQKKGTVQEPRTVFQTPEESLTSRQYELKLADYYKEAQSIFPRLPLPGAEQKMMDEQNVPLVSVIIPVFNNLKYTHMCIKAIIKNTRYPRYEVIIVDNASTDGTGKYLSSLGFENFKIVSNTENLGFVGGCNAGANVAEGEFIFIKDNDTEVQPNWISSVVSLMKERPDCGIVGSKLIYPDGELQEAGGIVFSDGDGWNLGRGMDPRDPRFNYVREIDYCSGTALTIRASLWKSIGGFDPLYSPAYYEDTDLCFSVRKLGYKILYQPLSEVVHYEGKTGGTDIGSGFKRFQAINRKKFQKKWSWELQAQYEHNPDNVIQAAERGNKTNILIADPFLPMWDRASGSLRLFQTIEILAASNYHVVFISRMSSPGDVKYIKRLIELGVEVYPQDVRAMKAVSNDPALDKIKGIDYNILFKEKQFKYAILSFWDIAAYYTPIIRKLSPQTHIIVDTVDVHFVRELREAELSQDKKSLAAANARKPLEIGTYKKADSLWVVTQEDLDELKQVGVNKPTHILPNIHKPVPFEKKYAETQDLLFVGNFSHTPNQDAILYFCKSVFPLIKQELPDVSLYIVGNNPTVEVFELAREDIIVTGFVEDISPYLYHARISVNPLRYGAGMKGKIGEALSWGLPVVTSSIGAEGMHLEDGVHCLLADEEKLFASHVVNAYKNEDVWNGLSEKGRELVEDKWSPSASKKVIDRVLEVEAPILRPDVSIIILTWNALKYTQECVESILAHTQHPYEIIFVDNASSDGSLEYIQDLVEQHPNFRLISNAENKGFAAANNQGVKAANGKYVLLLNNDVLVSKGWLSNLVSAYEKDEHIGMIGPITNHISGRQMLTEVPYTDEPGFQKFAQQVLVQNTNKITPRRRIAGFAVLMEKELYDAVDGLDESFGTGNYEDDDLCLKVREQGKAIMVHEGVFIHHYGSQTFKANKMDYSASLETKGMVFRDKWPDVDYEELIEVKNPLSESHPNMYMSAMSALENGDLNSAYNLMSKLVDENPLYEDALSGLAMIARAQQKSDEATALLNRVLMLNPSHVVALNLSGLLAAESGDLDSAQNFFRLAVQCDPSFLDARRNYAEVLLMGSDFENGVQELLDIVTEHPQDIPTLLRLANLNIEAGRVEDARELAHKILEIDPAQAEALSMIKSGEK